MTFVFVFLESNLRHSAMAAPQVRFVGGIEGPSAVFPAVLKLDGDSMLGLVAPKRILMLLSEGIKSVRIGRR